MMNRAARAQARENRDVLEVWLPLLGLMALGAAWYHVLRLRERAILHARQLCDRHGLQLLDDSVGLHRLHARWRHGALQVTREYRFDTSLGGDDRRTASITLLGDRIVATRLPSREPPAGAAPVATSPFVPATLARGGELPDNVVPLDRRRRTLH
ncbi:MAG TPA: DUF3301 domain-containing protein [Rhodanobacteraceae bacterium]|jgi:hypothetical protein|nr:DUF3301 domain-containing protein [Rhodanobacteraceae bacterium]